MCFIINEPVDIVFLGKAIRLFVFMLPDSFHKLRGYANAERAVLSTGENMDTELLVHWKLFPDFRLRGNDGI